MKNCNFSVVSQYGEINKTNNNSSIMQIIWFLHKKCYLYVCFTYFPLIFCMDSQNLLKYWNEFVGGF